MTEGEAKTKWCPQAGPSRFERQGELCMGSACAVWVDTTPLHGEQLDTEERVEKGDPPGEGWRWVPYHRLNRNAPQGFWQLLAAPVPSGRCGLSRGAS